MKRIFMSACLLLSAVLSNAQDPAKDSFYTLSPVEVRAVRAGDKTPFSKTDISRKEVSSANFGQDIPFLLDQTPSVVINSDAGNGIGYTGIRIRGTDATRINITLNGIPYNDAESQGTFFVDLPDFASSVGSIQLQRGVGTSSNGAGAFGASINFSSNERIDSAYLELNNSFGSFNSWKNTFRAGTGSKHRVSCDIRLSHISSDGFIDRAFSKLRSLYFSTAYTGRKNSLRLNLITGHEKTYQAWYGISEADLRAGHRTINYAGTEKPGEPYANETDNYTQTHFQLFFNQEIISRLQFSTAFFLTKGKGYYEQYKAAQDFSSYGLPYRVQGADTIFTADFIRQLWLDNNYYGNIFSLQYRDGRTLATLGGAVTRYDGNHFGELVWGSAGLPAPHRWYDLDARKSDFTIYLKEQTQFAQHWNYFYDLQYRHVQYDIHGFRDNPSLFVSNHYDFFNPKLGIVYKKNEWKSYLSCGIANKEPNREDFEAGAGRQPRREHLQDFEYGIGREKSKCSWSATLFYMRYRDQLVLTGEINDVGAYTRTNVPESYRAGIELQGGFIINPRVKTSANLAWSRNKVMDFAEYTDDYDNGGQLINHYKSSNIAYSPAVVAAFTLTILPLANLEISLPGKYVGKQYLDNTQHEDRVLPSFFVQDLRVLFHLKKRSPKEISLLAQVSNLFAKKYEPNGYTYNYIYGGNLAVENYYFPMAGIHFMAGINLRW